MKLSKIQVASLAPIAAIVATGLMAPAAYAEDPTTTPTSKPTTTQQQDSGTIDCGDTSKLSREEKVGQILTVAISDKNQLDKVKTEGFGNIYISSAGTKALLTGKGKIPALKTSKNIPVGVSIDEEGGKVSRLADIAGTFPSAAEQAKLDDSKFKDIVGKRAKVMKDKGLTRDYAPVVDVAAPDGVLGDRVFSNDPKEVSKQALRFAQALQKEGVDSTLKHFPGHGSATGDTHKTTAKTPEFSKLKEKDLVPYKELIGNELINTVMVAHVEVPGLTEKDTPASLSPKAIALLRDGKDYGAKPFEGVILTDDLSAMKAATAGRTVSEAAVKAVKAGVDSPLIDYKDAADVKTALVKDKSIKDEQLTKSVDRILAAKHCKAKDSESSSTEDTTTPSSTTEKTTTTQPSETAEKPGKTKSNPKPSEETSEAPDHSSVTVTSKPDPEAGKFVPVR